MCVGPVESGVGMYPLQFRRRFVHPRVPSPLHREGESGHQAAARLLQKPLGANGPRHRSEILLNHADGKFQSLSISNGRRCQRLPSCGRHFVNLKVIIYFNQIVLNEKKGT